MADDSLTVQVDDRRHTLRPGQALTFGRDASCTVRLDATDLGISRTAGRVHHDGSGWQVTNLSRKRTLHLVDAYGFATPLPVAATGWPSSARAVGHPHTTVLVAGQEWTYALVLTPAARPAQPTAPQPVDPRSTRNQVPALTPRQRAVLVAMARGYLRPYPHYDPRPHTYNEIAERLGLTRTQVVRRVERVREQLVAAGVLGLEGEGDARRALCEWLLATRVISPADLDRPAMVPDPAPATEAPAAGPVPPPAPATPPTAASGPVPASGPASASVPAPVPDPRPGAGGTPAAKPAPPPRAALERPETGGPDTRAVTIARQVEAVAEDAAREIAPLLERRLVAYHGPDWLAAVNSRRRRGGHKPGQRLRDFRFCLAVLGHDPATEGWANRACRRAALDLNRLAFDAVHRGTLTVPDLERARKTAARLLANLPAG
ncbi:hypothetical protein [Polymorphospora sp. NPDC050346]|uniref:hypothetical protein n=1 Tax=Polymorphospora sp. NPDC050346 TaxID=3155780 RepID=UPI0033FD1F16